MKKFTDYLATLENTDHIQKIDLFDTSGALAGTIENKPGSQGSVKVYHHLLKKWSGINKEAAKEGLKSTRNTHRTRKKIQANTRISIDCLA